MITSLDYSILVLGLIIDIPIFYAIWHMWSRRKYNGINKLVRTLTLWWIVAFAIRHNVALFSRFEMNTGHNIDNDMWDAIFFLANMFVAVATIYGAAVLYIITKGHNEPNH